MSSLTTIIDDITAVAKAQSDGDPKAHITLLECIQRLTLAAETPAETAKRLLYQPPTNVALCLAMELGLVTAIERENDSITAIELADQLDVEELLIVRLMRALTAMGVCSEVGPRTYSSNAVAKEFATSGLGAGVITLYDTFLPAAANIVKSLEQRHFQVPKEAKDTPFYYTSKTTMFQWLKENQAQRSCFDLYMAGRRKEIKPWFEIFPMTAKFEEGLHQSSEAVLLVDVGGSHGHDVMQFKKRYPQLPGSLILQDLPETLSSLQSPPENITLMPYDFFEPQPVKGARLYHFGAICHDWSDEYCVKFLSNTARAMDQDYSTLLIRDYVVPEMGASLRSASLDLQMMMLVAGMERTKSQWEKLLDCCGLCIVQVWYSGGGTESIIETRVKH